jgi:transposase
MPTRVVFEATGAYHRSFEQAFSGTLPLVKLNPLQARRFAQACGTRVKTDAVDASMLARFGNTLALESDLPIDGKQFELKELFSSRGALIKDRTRLLNHFKTQSLTLVKQQTKARIEKITRQLKTVQQDINTRLRDCPGRARANTILRSIPGIGEVAAATNLIEMPELETLQKRKLQASLDLLPPLAHVNLHCWAVNDPTIGKGAWQSHHSGRPKTATRRTLYACSRGIPAQPRHVRQIHGHDQTGQAVKGRSNSYNAKTH